MEPTLKPLEEIIWENVFCLGGNQDHVPACLCYMFYCVVHSERFNLAYFMAKLMEWVTKQKRLILPYGMLLTHLFKFIVRENPKLENESYVLYDRVMPPLAAQLEQKPKRDRGTRRCRHSTSSSSAFDQSSSSHLNDDDDENDEGTSRASTPSPIRYFNSLTNQVPQVLDHAPLSLDLGLSFFLIIGSLIITVGLIGLSVDLNEPKDSSKTDKAAQNGRTPKSLTLEIHHGGWFTPTPSRSYIGGHVSSHNY
ncbi:hypothetical protein Tco_1403417 [Tanacetum coccineum]